MRKKTLKRKLAKTEKKLEKVRTELRHTKDRLNAIIAGTNQPEVITDEPARESLPARIESFLRS